MTDALGMSSDIIAGGATLGGLLLVFLGNATAGFDSFEKTQQTAVRWTYQKKAWSGAVGVATALTASGLALLGKWLDNLVCADVAAVLLLISVVWAVLAAFSSASEIR